jgi:hypothetical protein
MVYYLGTAPPTLTRCLYYNKIVRIITNTKSRDSYKEVLKNLEIIILYSQYIYSLILYTVNNKYLYGPRVKREIALSYLAGRSCKFAATMYTYTILEGISLT